MHQREHVTYSKSKTWQSVFWGLSLTGRLLILVYSCFSPWVSTCAASTNFQHIAYTVHLRGAITWRRFNRLSPLALFTPDPRVAFDAFEQGSEEAGSPYIDVSRLAFHACELRLDRAGVVVSRADSDDREGGFSHAGLRVFHLVRQCAPAIAERVFQVRLSQSIKASRDV